MSRTIAVSGAMLAILGVIAVPIAGAADADRPVKRTVKVRDNFFAPSKLAVPRNSRITWRWPAVAGDVHDVYLRRRPKGVRRFHSDLAASAYSFSRRLRKPGVYRIVCTIHAEMSMRIRARR